MSAHECPVCREQDLIYIQDQYGNDTDRECFTCGLYQRFGVGSREWHTIETGESQ